MATLLPEGHGAGNNRVLKFDKTGVHQGGKLALSPTFDQPHALAFDSKGLLYVGIAQQPRAGVRSERHGRQGIQWSRLSGIFIKTTSA